MRAILLASAMATTLNGRRARSYFSQGYFSGFCLARCSTECSPCGQLRNLVDVSLVGAPKISSGGANGLADLELVIAQTTLLIDEEIETVSARQAETLAI